MTWISQSIWTVWSFANFHFNQEINTKSMQLFILFKTAEIENGKNCAQKHVIYNQISFEQTGVLYCFPIFY